MIDLSKSQLTIDVGCGSKPEHFPLPEREDVIHVDLEIRSFNKPIIEVRCDAHHLPFRDNIFNKAFCTHTLEHCRSPWHVLNEINRVTNCIAIVKVKVPYLKNILMSESPRHLFTWSKSSFENLLRQFFSDVKVYESQRLRMQGRFPLRRTLSSILRHIFGDELTGVCKK